MSRGWGFQVGRIVAIGSRLLRRRGRAGLDRRLVRIAEKEGKLHRAIERELVEIFEEFARRVQQTGGASLTRAELKREIGDLLARLRALKGEREAQQLARARGRLVSEEGTLLSGVARAEESTGRAGNVLGRTPGELDNTAQALQRARQDALADIKESKNLTAAEKRALSQGVKDRFATRLAQVLRDSATARRLFAYWEAEMTPKKLKTIFGEVSQRFERQRAQLAELMQQLDQLRARAARQPGGATQKDLARQIGRLAEKLRDKKGPITAALRGAFKRNRRQILKRMFEDADLVKDLEGIDLVLQPRRGSGTVQLRVRVRVGGKAESFLLNVDHARTQFEDAVDQWIVSGDPARLQSILQADNLQLVEGIENQVALVALRKPGFVSEAATARPRGVEAPALRQFAGALDAAAPRVDVDGALAGLGRALAPEERETIEWVKAQLDTF